MIRYIDLGADKQLNEIIFTGGHDAAITQGKRNAKTQDLDILGQAKAGVRLFDLRIAAQDHGDAHGNGREVTLRAYHGSVSKEKAPGLVRDLGTTRSVDAGKMSLGTFGLGLDKILQDAAAFVAAEPSEFLLLKFDKCRNWPLIAEACVTLLGNALYKGTGNLNTTTLRQLAGKVVVLFTGEGVRAVSSRYPVGSGILEIRSLKGKEGDKPYAASFHGMQYYGKGGTRLGNLVGDKIKENRRTQAAIMRAGAEGHPDVIGMMYWTSTGLLESIRQRNERQWSVKNVSRLNQLWREGLAESIETRLAKHVDPTRHAFGNVLKAFMPNVVMVDFADAQKCRTIYGLNHVAATALTDAARALDAEITQLQTNMATLPRAHRG